MKSEDYSKYKSKIESLSEEEHNLRDYYLQDLASGKILGPQVGYPSIDRPWLSNVNIDKLHEIKNDKTIYQDILEQNKDYLDDICIEFFGAKIKYRTLFEKIDNTAKAFVKMGVKPGDYVTICCAGTPELIYSVYALSKIGAVANLMAPYFEKNQMIDRITDCKSNILVVMDKFYNDIKDAIDASIIEKIIVTPTLNSSPLHILPNKDKVECDNVDIINWNYFLDSSTNEKDVEVFPYEENYPLCLVYSSGTTGASKAILLTNDSFQYSVLSYNANKFDINRGQKMYQIIPPWYSTGLNTSIHLALHSGVTVFQDPRFERDVFVKNVIKHKINYAVAPTSMYEGFLDKKNTLFKKLKCFENPFEGGEPLPYEVKQLIETVWKKMGCNSKLTAGYGQCECGATVTSPSQHFNHHDGSVALPIPGVNLAIFDDDNHELGFNQRGNLYVETPCGMREYLNNKKATDEYFYYDEYGHRWNKTGDIGYIETNGDLFLLGRASDYVNVRNKKIYGFDVEKPIMVLDEIDNCDCLSYNHEGEEKLALHIIFNPEYLKTHDMEDCIKYFQDIQRLIYEEYNDLDAVPEYFKVRKEFPYKPSGKRDIEKLKAEQDSFIYVDKVSTLTLSNIRKRK